jgi:hypothetical protein
MRSKCNHRTVRIGDENRVLTFLHFQSTRAQLVGSVPKVRDRKDDPGFCRLGLKFDLVA